MLALRHVFDAGIFFTPFLLTTAVGVEIVTIQTSRMEELGVGGSGWIHADATIADINTVLIVVAPAFRDLEASRANVASFIHIDHLSPI